MPRICQECVLDDSAGGVEFDEFGSCQFCLEYRRLKPGLLQAIAGGPAYFASLDQKLKAEQRGPYDAILGISGGVDSSYVALLAKQQGWNPLLVHFDNGWNSETAVSNIQKISKVTGFDLDTYVIDWSEFRDLQRAFLKASVVDIEMLTDHAILAALFQLSRKHKTPNILSGTNQATEFGLPSTWIWNKLDWVNIKGIHRRFGQRRLRTFPHLPTWRYIAMARLGFGVTFHSLLDHVPYRKLDAMQQLQREFGWEYYGGKHYESTFTKFYQAYILPKKFGIDKRRAHLSSLIRNDEITREHAIAELEEPLYDPAQLELDLTYVRKKLGFNEFEFQAILDAPALPHSFYPTDQRHFRIVLGLYHGLQRALGIRRTPPEARS